MSQEYNLYTNNLASKYIYNYCHVIEKQIQLSMRKVMPHINQQKLHIGFLYLFFGEEVADAYRLDDEEYFEHYVKKVPSVLSMWFCQQIVSALSPPLDGKLFECAISAHHTLMKHAEKLSTNLTLTHTTAFTAFFPSVYPVIYRGKCQPRHATYYPFPNAISWNYSEKSTIHTLLVWVLNISKKRFLVSLSDASDFISLKALQKEREVQHQLHMLNAIVKGYQDFEVKRTYDLASIYSSSSPSHINYERIQYCSYETFLHLSTDYSNDQYKFIAQNILNQINTDFAHHGFLLSSIELSLFFGIYFSITSSKLMIMDKESESFYTTDIGLTILKLYIKEDQRHSINRSHLVTVEEREGQSTWWQKLKVENFPPRLYQQIKKNALNYNELYLLTGKRSESFYGLLTEQYREIGYTFDGYFCCFARLLLDAGCNIKYVLLAHHRFSYNEHYLHTYLFGSMQLHYTLNLNFIHDYYEVLHPQITRLFYALSQAKNKPARTKIANIILKAMLSYNLESRVNLIDLTQTLTQLITYMQQGYLLNKQLLANLNKRSSLRSILVSCQELEVAIDSRLLEIIKRTIHVNVKHIHMASKMLVKAKYVKLCSALCNNKKYPLFHTPSPCQELLQEFPYFSVGVFTHHNPLALLGPSLSNVCIDLSSHYHHQQLNPSFMNLCVYNNDRLFLWGLLCRAYSDDGEVIYILNNFQGALGNRINTKEVQVTIINSLQAFIELNDIDAIFLKDQYFNAINLCADLPSMKRLTKFYYLERQARLDFKFNTSGRLQDENFYLLTNPQRHAHNSA